MLGWGVKTEGKPQPKEAVAMQRRSQAQVTGSQPPPGGPAMVPAVAHVWLISSKSRRKTEPGGPYARGAGGDWRVWGCPLAGPSQPWCPGGTPHPPQLVPLHLPWAPRPSQSRESGSPSPDHSTGAQPSSLTTFPSPSSPGVFYTMSQNSECAQLRRQARAQEAGTATSSRDHSAGSQYFSEKRNQGLCWWSRG